MLYPYGYWYLGYCQSLAGHAIKLDLVQAIGKEHDLMYITQAQWLNENILMLEINKTLGIHRK